MERKRLIYIGLFVGSTIGGFIPSLWDSAMFSMAGVLSSAIGGLLGIYLGFKMSE